MTALEFFEYLAYNSRYDQTYLDSLLANQKESFKQAFINKNSQEIKKHFSSEKMFADKTTIFNINY